MKLAWMIGGTQGTGVDTSAIIFGNAIAAAGYYIFGNREYHSNIKGRHSYLTVAISDKRIHSIPAYVNILASFDAETVFQHFREVNDALIYNSALGNVKLDSIQSMEAESMIKIEKFLREQGYGTTLDEVLKYLKSKNIKIIGVNYDEIIKKVATEAKVLMSIADRVKNTIAIAVSYKLLGLPKEYLLNALTKAFKKDVYVKLNSIAVEESFSITDSLYHLYPLSLSAKRVQLDGNTAVAIGKIRAGLRFQSYYPITPASDESVYIEAHQEVFMEDPNNGEKRKTSIVVVQTEDELAAINMAAAAALTGVRAATATSGPGFSLMAEGIGWAGMNEAPVVVTFYMRAGPSTGMATRTGQSDLIFSMFVSHGEFPKIVIASGDHVEAFHDAIWAFDLAERYQTPVIHLVEKTLANSYSIIDESEILTEHIADRGKIIDNPPLDYKRFEITDDGISPRAFLGSVPMYYTGDEHNEYGIITEEGENRIRMYEKRMRKLETADKEIPEERRIRLYGDIDSDIIILTWGAAKGPIIDILDELKEEGINVGVLQIKMFSPYPKNLIRKLLSSKRKIIDVEGNYLAQASLVTKMFTGIEPTNYILKYNGRLILRDELKDAIKLVINKDEKKVILNGGD